MSRIFVVAILERSNYLKIYSGSKTKFNGIHIKEFGLSVETMTEQIKPVKDQVEHQDETISLAVFGKLERPLDYQISDARNKNTICNWNSSQ